MHTNVSNLTMTYSFKTHQWTLVRKNNETPLKKIQTIVNKVMNDPSVEFETISGNHLQTDIMFSKPLAKHIANYMCFALQQYGVNTTSLILSHLKLLIAEPGAKQQLPHRDGVADGVYNGILYLQKCRSTQVSINPYDFNSEDHKASAWSNLIFFDVNAGDMMIFNENVIHCGPANETKSDRAVLFASMVPIDLASTHDVEKQQFEIHEIEACHGIHSLEYWSYMRDHPEIVKHL